MGPQTEQLSDHGAALRWSDGLRAALLGWLAARVAVGIGFLLAHGLSGSVALPDGRLHLDQGLMTWDGTFYRVITRGWYSGSEVPTDAVRFFPGYPAIGRVFETLFLGHTDLALLFVANVAAIGAAVLVWRLAAEGTGEPAVGIRAAWMVSIIPAANVMVFAYSESLMLLIATAVLWALLRGRPGWAALGGLAAGLLRPAGILLALPAAVEAFQWYRARNDLHQLAHDRSAEQATTGQATTEHGTTNHTATALRWGAAVGAPAAGLAIALWVVSRRTGDVFEAYRIQRQLRDGFRDPLSRLAQAGIDFAGGHLHDVYNVVFALGFAALFVIAWRHSQRLSWLAFMAVTWIVAVGGNNMDSVGRYCMVAAPFTIALAQWADTRARRVGVAAIALSGTVWFTSEVLLGRIIP